MQVVQLTENVSIIYSARRRLKFFGLYIFTIYFARSFRRICMSSYVYGAAGRKFWGFEAVRQEMFGLYIRYIFCPPQFFCLYILIAGILGGNMPYIIFNT